METRRCTKPVLTATFTASKYCWLRAHPRPSGMGWDSLRFTKRSGAFGKRPANPGWTGWPDKARRSTGCFVLEPILRFRTAAEEPRWCWPSKATMPRCDRRSVHRPLSHQRLLSLQRCPNRPKSGQEIQAKPMQCRLPALPSAYPTAQATVRYSLHPSTSPGKRLSCPLRPAIRRK